MFSNYAHDCTLDNITGTYDYQFVHGNSVWSKIKRWFIRIIVVSETSKLYTYHLRSYGAITKERKRQLKYYRFRIHPFSIARTAWAIVMCNIIIIQLITTPFDFLLFNATDSFIYTSQWQLFKMLLDAVLILNILVSCLTGYYDEPKQEVVLDFRKIIMNYLKTHLVLDIISSIPVKWGLFFNLSMEAHFALTWVLLLKYALPITYSKYAKIIADHYNIHHYMYMTTMVFLYTFIFWHVMCCSIHFITIAVRGTQNFDKASENRKAVWMLYVNAVHTKSLLLYTTGYDKNLPSNEMEIVVIYSVWYGSSLFFIYILAMIMEINKARTSSAHKYDVMEKQLKEYMQHKQLPTPLREKILTYYEFKFQRRYFRENEILATISEQLRQEMNLHACRKLVENVIFFRNLPLNLLVRIISCLQIELYLVNDVIIRANTPGASMYFISTGTVAVYTKSGKEICHLEDGAHFGEVALIIKDTFRIASVIAVEVSEIYRLDQKDFVKAINPYPDLLANIQHIAAERMEVASMLDEYNKREQAMKKFNLIT